MSNKTFIDLRSDTVTLPSPNMYRAMAEAELGDDVLGDDPTVKRLEAMAAERMGMEAAMYVTSGTQGNLAAMMTHCRRGEEVLLGHRSHLFNAEQGAISTLGGIIPHTVPNQPDGRMELDDIESAIRMDSMHLARTRAISLENTHNNCSGAVVDVNYTQQVVDLAQRRGLKLHIDGARIFNAAVALGIETKALVAGADSVSFCLSKGLSCPVGSVVCGSEDFIAEARRNRKALGGALRQVGILAACGIVALNEMVDRLAEDHDNAKRLAEGLADIPGIETDPEQAQTNLVFFDLQSGGLTGQDFVGRLGKAGVKLLSTGSHRIRSVTHYGITSDDIDAALMTIQKVLA